MPRIKYSLAPLNEWIELHNSVVRVEKNADGPI
jgi:hypothetical protein